MTDNATRVESTLSRVLVLGVVLLLAVAPLTAGFAGVSTAASATEETTKLDIVFVFDRSESTNDDRYSMANEIDALAERLNAAGVDARFALVTYSDTVSVQQPLTSDFAEFERAMHYQERGNEEQASDAIPTATAMDFRENATRVVVLFTDEDDDSSAASRTNARAALDDVTFISVSPAAPYESSCAVHSPPCDNETANELRTMASQVGGSWIDVNLDASMIVDRIGDVLDPRSTTTNTKQADRSSPSANFVTTELSTNVSMAEVGDPIAFTKTVENTGSATGTYEAYLSQNGEILAERSVDVPARSTRTITFVRTFDQPGSYTLQITHESVGPVEVTDAHDAAVTTATSADGTVIRASVTDARANATVTIPVDSSTPPHAAIGAIRNLSISVGDVNVTPPHDVAFDVELAANDAAPNGTRTLPGHVTNGTYLTVTSTLEDDLTGVQFEYGTRSNDTVLLGYDANASQWELLTRTATMTANGTTTWQTDSNTYRTYALGTGNAQFEVTDVSLHARQLTLGETAGITVTVANTGSAAGTHTVTVTMDGAPYAEQVTVPATASREVVLRFTPENAGTYPIQVDGGPTQTLDVQPVTTTTTATATTTTEPTTTATRTSTSAPPTTTDGSSQLLAPGFALVTMALAGILLGLLAYRRR